VSSTVVLPGDGEVLLVKGERSFLIAGQARSRFSLCIETQDDEYCQSIWPHHVIAVSAPEGGSLTAAAMLFASSATTTSRSSSCPGITQGPGDSGTSSPRANRSSSPAPLHAGRTRNRISSALPRSLGEFFSRVRKPGYVSRISPFVQM